MVYVVMIATWIMNRQSLIIIVWFTITIHSSFEFHGGTLGGNNIESVASACECKVCVKKSEDKDEFLVLVNLN